MKKALLLTLLAGGLAAGAIGIGINIGPQPPPPVAVARPPLPGPGYNWIDGYWYPVGGHYRWHAGYWTRPPYEGAIWVGPRHDGRQFFEGHWEGPHGVVEHDHRWDRDRERDFHRDRH